MFEARVGVAGASIRLSLLNVQCHIFKDSVLPWLFEGKYCTLLIRVQGNSRGMSKYTLGEINGLHSRRISYFWFKIREANKVGNAGQEK